MGGTDLNSTKEFKFVELKCGFYALAVCNESFYLIDTNEMYSDMFDDIFSTSDETFVAYKISEDQFISLATVSKMKNEDRKTKTIKHINSFDTLTGKVFKKDGELNTHKYAFLRDAIDGRKIYFQKITTGKYASRTDHSLWIKVIIEGAGFKVKKANDAPRGGFAGDHFIVSKKAVEFLQSLI